jgi:hypothetical protein
VVKAMIGELEGLPGNASPALAASCGVSGF